MWETEQFRATIDFHGIFFTMEVNGQVATVLTHFLKNIFICVQENKEIHKWFGTT